MKDSAEKGDAVLGEEGKKRKDWTQRGERRGIKMMRSRGHGGGNDGGTQPIEMERCWGQRERVAIVGKGWRRDGNSGREIQADMEEKLR